MKRLFAILIVLFSAAFTVSAQDDDDLIQFSGVVLNIDSLTPVSFSNIIIKNSHRGTISDYYGYFSFVAEKGDTIQFSAIGYSSSEFIIPDSLTNNKYSLIKILQGDTVRLPEAVVYPWPTREQFKQAFLNLNVPDDDMERARKNLFYADMQQRMGAMPMTASMNYKNYMQQYSNQLYHAGQLPPQNIFNPLAWAKFIEAWRNGDFRNDK